MLKKLLEWESLQNETLLTTNQKLCLCFVEIIKCLLDILSCFLILKIIGTTKFWGIPHYFGFFLVMFILLIARISKVFSKGTK